MLRIFLYVASLCFVFVLSCADKKLDNEGANAGSGGEKGDKQEECQAVDALVRIAPLSNTRLGTKVTVAVSIDSDKDADKSAEVTLNIKCDGKDALKGLKVKADASTKTATFTDVLTLTADATKGIQAGKQCTVHASASIGGKEEKANAVKFSIEAIPTASWSGGKLLLKNASNYVQLATTGDDPQQLCGGKLLIWPADSARPSVALPESGFAVAADGSIADLYAVGNLDKCKLVIDGNEVEISGTAPANKFTSIGEKSGGRICLKPIADITAGSEVRLAVAPGFPNWYTTSFNNRDLNTSTCHDVSFSVSVDFTVRGTCTYVLYDDTAQHTCRP